METIHIKTFLAVLGRSTLEAGILVLLVLVAQWLFRKQLTPHWRCTLWLLVVVRLLLPFSLTSITSIFNLLPPWTQSALAVPPQAKPPAPQVPIISPLVLPADPSTTVLRTTAPIVKRHAPPWPVWILATWLAGTVLLATHLLISSLRLWRRCAALPHLTQPEVLALLQECCALLKMRTGPALLETIEVSTPALHGLFRPQLLLPKGFITRFSPAELRFVFLHELAHLKRRDLWLNWVVATLQVVHWFNPLIWFGFSRWRADRESACDAIALEAAGEEHKEQYGRTILRLLETFARPVSTPGLVGILEDKRRLQERIRLISAYVPANRWSRMALVVAAALAVIGLTDAQNQSQPLNDSKTASNNTAPKAYDMNTSNVTNHLARAATIGLLALASSTNPVTLHADDTPATQASSSQFANDLIGAWVLVGEPGDVHDAPAAGGRFKFFTGKYWCNTQADPKTGVVLYHHGGTYTLDGNLFSATLQYANPSTMYLIGRTNGHFNLKIENNLLTSIGIDNSWKEVWKRADETSGTPSQLAKDLIGAWILVGTPGDVGPIPKTGGRLKFITGSHWLDTQADPKTGVIIYHHGGTYSLNGNEYTQNVEYANPTTLYLVGNHHKYNIKVEGDTFTMIGLDSPRKEVWKRAP